MKQAYRNLRISVKMTMLYLAILALSSAISYLVYTGINGSFTARRNGDLSMQVLYSIRANIYSLIDNTANYSRIIMGSRDIQSALRDLEQGGVWAARELENALIVLISSMPTLDSVCIFDVEGNLHYASNGGRARPRTVDISLASWYGKVMRLYGSYILTDDVSGVFPQQAGESAVAMVRAVSDNVTQLPSGVLLMNISDESLRNSYRDIVERYDSKIIIMDEDGELIRNDEGYTPEQLRQVLSLPAGEPQMLTLDGVRCLFSTMNLERFGWKLIIGLPMELTVRETAFMRIASVTVILINMALLWLGIMLVARQITVPIHRLLKAMRGIEGGRFAPFDMECGNDEIGQLKDGYNLMMIEIRQLLQRTVDDQKMLRKAELNALQEQIKPHFLYNTLDAMRYLALSGDKRALYDALEALGDYYNRSLSKGNEIVTIADEVAIVQDYLHLQKLRYGENIKFRFDIAPETLWVTTPKLILQPIVENAIYHGLMPKGEEGEITVSARLDKNHVVLEVKDDGVGMTPEEMTKIDAGMLDGNMASFGMRGTIKRIKIYFECEDLYAIESEKNVGTTVTLRIPIKKEKAENER